MKSYIISVSLSFLIGKRALIIPISFTYFIVKIINQKALAYETGQINISCCNHHITLVIDTFGALGSELNEDDKNSNRGMRVSEKEDGERFKGGGGPFAGSWFVP